MALVSNSAMEKFDSAIHSAPNDLTQVLRGHRAVEIEIHQALGLHLRRSSRLDLHKIPFLTKVDLLMSLGSLSSVHFPLFAEVNRLRNRFAHDPDATISEDDLVRFKSVYSSSLGKPVPPELNINTPNHAVRFLLLVVYTAARSCYEYGVNDRVQSRAINKWLADENLASGDRYKDDEFDRIRQEADRKLARASEELLRTEHPDVEFRYLHGTKKENDEK